MPMRASRCAGLVVVAWTIVLAAMLHGHPQNSAATISNRPTFTRDVASILYKNCTTCHRPGEMAPMSLLTYSDARPWARSIRNKVSLDQMPPWHADPRHGAFLNDRHLSERDKQTLIAWVDAGAPEGDPSELPRPPEYTPGWMMGRPDAVVSLPEDYPVAATGTIDYQYFEVPTGFTEDKWVEAMEARPGARGVVHHVVVFARLPQPSSSPAAFKIAEGLNRPSDCRPDCRDKLKPFDPLDRPAPARLGNMVGVFTPGQLLRVYEPGTALRLRPGTVLVFQMHYTTNGIATTDRTQIGFRFAKEPPIRELRLATLENGSFKIPPGVSDYHVDAEMTTLQDVSIWSILPHAHVRGKAWEYHVTFPDGRTDTLLAVPRYDFNWQTEYVFKQPVRLPKGTTLHATAQYDNSMGNRSNPDPSHEVLWGDQTWQEMM